MEDSEPSKPLGRCREVVIASNSTIVIRWAMFAAFVGANQDGVHAVNLRHRVSACTALHLRLQNFMPHLAQL